MSFNHSRTTHETLRTISPSTRQIVFTHAQSSHQRSQMKGKFYYKKTVHSRTKHPGSTEFRERRAKKKNKKKQISKKKKKKQEKNENDKYFVVPPPTRARAQAPCGRCQRSSPWSFRLSHAPRRPSQPTTVSHDVGTSYMGRVVVYATFVTLPAKKMITRYIGKVTLQMMLVVPVVPPPPENHSTGYIARRLTYIHPALTT